ncbi:putative MFS family arabinose efflux permease [Kribbella voronezhensis]|uniref:Putative MFS family arabinose efflux permease n=1 Tax=Kribbella voronezhensis TaxID=2512212 RepID=A0A4R7SXA6_9ACTN|nr:MFS transporter [Kribbella voronezhensis]TDU83891.1 putative MFS family arabinose efflux permease [Kribbella voronezhensis]
MRKGSRSRRDFQWLLLGQTTSQFGAQISGIAVPLLAVSTLRASPLQVGLVTAAGTVAFAVIGLPAGAWIDRVRRRPVLVAGDLSRAALLISIPVTAWLGRLTVTQLVVVSLLIGVARVFFDVGYQSYLPDVVGKQRLIAGNSAMETVRASGQVAGPGLGGWLVGRLGSANVLLIQAMALTVSAACLLAIKVREPQPTPQPEHSRLSGQIKEGLGFLSRSPVLRAMTVTSAVGNFSFAVASAVNYIFLVRTLRLSPAAVGVLLAVGSVTAMLGAALTPRLANRFGSARIVWLSLVVPGPIALLGPLARPGLSVSLVVLGTAVSELGQIVYAISSVSLRQQLCPTELLGRVNASARTLIMALFPVGALLGGVLGEWLGIRPTLWLALTLAALSPLPAYRALRLSRTAEDVTITPS